MFDRGTYGSIAVDDLDNAHIMLNNQKYNASVVYSQQAIEKILKQYIQQFGKGQADDLKSHKLLKLLKLTELQELQKFRGDVSEITDCYFDARYPGIDYTQYTKDDADRFLSVASDIVLLVIQKCQGGNPLQELSLD